MLDQVFQMFGMQPDIDLELMSHNQTLAQVTSRVLNAVSDVLAEHRPDLVLVHGDTTTAMAAALAAFYARVPIGHVEAGLRSYDLARPWPEEFNRVAVDCIADLLFAPTTTSAENLSREYNGKGRVLVTGNTGIDALFHVARLVDEDGTLRGELDRRYSYLNKAKHLVLVTGHRRESFGGGFEGICQGLKAVADRGDVEILYPVHLNPNVQGVVRKLLDGAKAIHLVDPVDYGDMVYLMRRAAILLTDFRRHSGGGPLARQAGVGHARRDGAAGGAGDRSRKARRHRPTCHSRRRRRAAGRPGATCQARAAVSLWRRPGIAADRGLHRRGLESRLSSGAPFAAALCRCVRLCGGGAGHAGAVLRTPLCLERADDCLDLVLADEGAVHAQRLAGAADSSISP